MDLLEIGEKIEQLQTLIQSLESRVAHLEAKMNIPAPSEATITIYNEKGEVVRRDKVTMPMRQSSNESKAAVARADHVHKRAIKVNPAGYLPQNHFSHGMISGTAAKELLEGPLPENGHCFNCRLTPPTVLRSPDGKKVVCKLCYSRGYRPEETK